MGNFFDFSNARNFSQSLVKKLKIGRSLIQVLVIQKNQTSATIDCLKYEKKITKNDIFDISLLIYIF